MEEAASRLSLADTSLSSPSSTHKPEPVAPPPTPVEPAGPIGEGNGQAGGAAGNGEVGGVSTASILSSLLEIHVEPAAPKPQPSAPQPSTTPAPTPVRKAPTVRSGATTILDSLQEIDLDNDEAPPALAPGQGLVSASRTLMELKAVEKMRSEMNAVAPVPSRRITAGPTGMPALDQALDRHGDEASRLAVFDRLQKLSSTSSGGRKAQLSRNAKARKSKGAEKEQAYTDRLCGRVVKTNKRKERMDRLKNLY